MIDDGDDMNDQLLHDLEIHLGKRFSYAYGKFILQNQIP